MRVNKVSGKLVRLFLAFIVGFFVAAFAPGASAVQASSEPVVVAEGQLEAESTEEDAAGSVFFLLGGMLLIIIAVVVTVVASVVVTAPLADEV